MATRGWAVQMGFSFHAINYKLGKPETRSIKAKLAQLKKVLGNFLKKIMANMKMLINLKRKKLNNERLFYYSMSFLMFK